MLTGFTEAMHAQGGPGIGCNSTEKQNAMARTHPRRENIQVPIHECHSKDIRSKILTEWPWQHTTMKQKKFKKHFEDS